MDPDAPERELADFSPGSSHLHGCAADLDSTQPCDRDCIHHLYAVAADADRLTAKVRDLAAEHAACSGCPTPWWLQQALEQS